MGTLIVFSSFSLLSALTVLDGNRRAHALERDSGEWGIDALGLVIQGILVPLLQVGAATALYPRLFPAWRGALRLPGSLAFLLNFVLVDYLYYWNHRWLHRRWLWSVHRVHHSGSQLDVFSTSRNTLWGSFFILYFWVNSFLSYCLSEPGAYLGAAALTAALDLYRHSRFRWRVPPSLEWLGDACGALFVSARDHAWHHSRGAAHTNFGANLKLWDRWHGTLHPEGTEEPKQLGVKLRLSWWRRAIFPFEPLRGRSGRSWTPLHSEVSR